MVNTRRGCSGGSKVVDTVAKAKTHRSGRSGGSDIVNTVVKTRRSGRSEGSETVDTMVKTRRSGRSADSEIVDTVCKTRRSGRSRGSEIVDTNITAVVPVPEFEQVMDLQVTLATSMGARDHMEDFSSVVLGTHVDNEGNKSSYAYFGVFDGHGGDEASKYAKLHLREHIIARKGFWSKDDKAVQKAIKDGFVDCHKAMHKVLDTWPKRYCTRTGSYMASTAGTTATVAFLRGDTLYVGHAGDSALVLGSVDENGTQHSTRLTIDHKPYVPLERARIIRNGGNVTSRYGYPERVVILIPKDSTCADAKRKLRSCETEEHPFLAVARSLGDFWSFVPFTSKFAVSPEPDVSVIKLDPSHRCLIFGSDGIWDVLDEEDVVMVALRAGTVNTSQTSVYKYANPAQCLVDQVNNITLRHYARMDNTTAIVVQLHPRQVIKDVQTRQAEEKIPSGRSFTELSDYFTVHHFAFPRPLEHFITLSAEKYSVRLEFSAKVQENDRWKNPYIKDFNFIQTTLIKVDESPGPCAMDSEKLASLVKSRWDFFVKELKERAVMVLKGRTTHRGSGSENNVKGRGSGSENNVKGRGSGSENNVKGRGSGSENKVKVLKGRVSKSSR